MNNTWVYVNKASDECAYFWRIFETTDPVFETQIKTREGKSLHFTGIDLYGKGAFVEAARFVHILETNDLHSVIVIK